MKDNILAFDYEKKWKEINKIIKINHDRYLKERKEVGL